MTSDTAVQKVSVCMHFYAVLEAILARSLEANNRKAVKLQFHADEKKLGSRKGQKK